MSLQNVQEDMMSIYPSRISLHQPYSEDVQCEITFIEFSSELWLGFISPQYNKLSLNGDDFILRLKTFPVLRQSALPDHNQQKGEGNSKLKMFQCIFSSNFFSDCSSESSSNPHHPLFHRLDPNPNHHRCESSINMTCLTTVCLQTTLMKTS